jgi:four helix bundle protein
MMPFERLEAWRLCHELVLAVYRLTGLLPTDERYGLVAQSRRAALSAACNIAEGSAKRGSREFRRYLDISIGSLAELAYLLRVIRDLGLIGPAEMGPVSDLHTDASRTTWCLYRAMGRR